MASSSLSFLRSLPLVLWSMEVTLLWVKPVTSEMVWMESRYQYRHRNTFRSVSGSDNRN